MDIPYDLLIKYARKRASQEEIRQAEQWLAEGDHHSLYRDLKEEWAYLDDTSMVSPDKHLLWQKIHTKTGQYHPKGKTRQIQILRIVAAASLLLAVSVSIVFYILSTRPGQVQPPQYTDITTTTNEKSKVELADGTLVWLNGNSSVTFDDRYDIDQREVTVSGELFFDVKPSGKKFIVNAGKIKVEVLGTSFNIRTSDNDDQIEIELVRGKVTVRNTENNQQLFAMDSLQYASINKSDLSHTLYAHNTSQCNIWTEESLNMYNEPLNVIINKLENWYGITISAMRLDFDKRYSFDIQNETIEEFLNLFSSITPIEYSVEGKKVSIRAKADENK